MGMFKINAVFRNTKPGLALTLLLVFGVLFNGSAQQVMHWTVNDTVREAMVYIPVTAKTQATPVIFAFHAYPWLIHRLTYRRHNHANLHVRGYKEEGTITTPFDMAVLNDLDRFHLVMDAINRLPQLGSRGDHLKQRLQDKLVEHKQYIDKHGEDMPEIKNWSWQ